MRVTLCARAKILQILEDGKSFRIQVSTMHQAGQHVDLIPNTEAKQFDCIINHIPHIVADYKTVTLMADQLVDFNYDTKEFVISTVKYEQPAAH